MATRGESIVLNRNAIPFLGPAAAEAAGPAEAAAPVRGGWRQRLPLLAVAGIVLAVVARQGLKVDWAAAARALLAADPWLLLAAVAVFAAAVPIRTLRWRTLVAAASDRPLPGFGQTLGIWARGWAGNCVTVAQLGDLYRATLLGRASGIAVPTLLGTIVAERMVDLGVLAALLAAATWVVVGVGDPTLRLAAGAVLGGILVAALAIASFDRWSGPVLGRLPARLADLATTVASGVHRSAPGVPLAALLSAAGWLLEGSMVFLLARAVGAPLPFGGALAVALIGALLTAIPLTPSGLGFTEAGLVVVLVRLGLAAETATALMLLIRLVTYWAVVGLGLGLTLGPGRRAPRTA